MTEAPRSLPSNIDAEKSTLGGILIENSVLHLATAHVGAKDFFRDVHRRIFAVVQQLIEAGGVADLVTVCEALDAKCDLEECGGPAYIASLVDGVPRSTNVGYYAQIVKEKAQLRAIISTANRTLADAYEADQSSAQIIQQAESALTNLSGVSVSPMQALQPAATFKRLEHRSAHKGEVTGIATGFSSIDALTLGWQKGEMNIIAARTSMGKSAFAMNTALAAARAGHRVAFFSLEMTRAELEDRLLSSISGVPLTRILLGTTNESEGALLTEALEEFNALPIFIDDTPGQSIVDVRRRCKQMAHDGGLGMGVVDYVQLMEAPSGQKLANRTEVLSATSRGAKNLARELAFCLILLSQLNRGDKDAKRKPELWDLRESGSLEQDANNVAFIHREDSRDSESEYILRKQRQGQTGSCKLRLHRDTVTFADAPAPAYQSALL